jgi:hypothetical protein
VIAAPVRAVVAEEEWGVADEEEVKGAVKAAEEVADADPVVAEARGRAASASAPNVDIPSRTNPVHPVSR